MQRNTFEKVLMSDKPYRSASTLVIATAAAAHKDPPNTAAMPVALFARLCTAAPFTTAVACLPGGSAAAVAAAAASAAGNNHSSAAALSALTSDV